MGRQCDRHGILEMGNGISRAETIREVDSRETDVGHLTCVGESSETAVDSSSTAQYGSSVAVSVTTVQHKGAAGEPQPGSSGTVVGQQGQQGLTVDSRVIAAGQQRAAQDSRDSPKTLQTHRIPQLVCANGRVGRFPDLKKACITQGIWDKSMYSGLPHLPRTMLIVNKCNL